MMRDWSKEITEFLRQEKVDISLTGQFAIFLRLLADMNTRINLTAGVSPLEMFNRFIRELFVLIPYVRPCQNILDLGSGAGYTGVTLKILFPRKEVVFLDSVGKKLQAVADICRKMELSEVSFIKGRAEELGHDKTCREKFDMVITRAVAPPGIVPELAGPFVVRKGYYAHYTTWHDRLKPDNPGLKKVGLHLDETLFCEQKSRKVVQILTKEKSTPLHYPRRFSAIKRAPLF